MARGHHRTAAMNGPDALDWFDSANELANEFNCAVWLECHPVGSRQGMIECIAAPVGAPRDLTMAVVGLPHPNTRFQSFWPTAFLLLHRLRRELEDKAYKAPYAMLRKK